MLKDLLQEEIIKEAEIVDDAPDNSDINGLFQINKKHGKTFFKLIKQLFVVDLLDYGHLFFPKLILILL